MAGEPPVDCLEPSLIEAYAEGRLSGEAVRRAERLLERNESCRAHFRERTAGKFPRIPNYTVLAQIGSGGFGVVYKAVHHGKERIEALKVLFGKAPILTSYFEREVHAVARLQHPRIATLYEAQLATPPFYYTMEYVDGARLNEHLRIAGPPLAERLRIVRMVAQDLGYAHAQGVVHRDVKPQNILVDGQGTPHIVDFGISMQLGIEESAARGESGGPLGTVGYIAPEQLAGQAVDARADIFALGALLFTAATNEPARHATDRALCLAALEQREIARADDLAAIIERCVARDPAERYPDCAALVGDLDRYVAGRSVSAQLDRTVGARGKRVLRLVFRNYQLPLRVAVALGAATLISAAFWTLGAHSFSTVDLGDQTVMIGFGPKTVKAMREGVIGADIPGLSPDDKKSWRKLHGALMERLAPAEPSVVVWDYFFPDCVEEFDAGFVRGVRALQSNGRSRVVVGASTFDVNGEPVLCSTIREAVHAYGSLHVTNPDLHEDQYQVTYCLERGFEDPVPSLAVAAFAAARNPDCRARLVLHGDERRLEIRYMMLRPVEGEQRMREPDSLELQLVSTGHERQGVWAADKVAHARIRRRSSEYWARKTYAYEDVLTADEGRLRDWFYNRAVIIGLMLPGQDQHLVRGGDTIFGCQIQAEALDALLAGSQPHRMTPADLAWRSVLWSAMAGALISARRAQYWRSLRGVTFSCGMLAAAGLLIASRAALTLANQYVLDLALAVSSLLVAGSAVFLVKAIGERFTQLSPPLERPLTPPVEGDTATTLLAETAVHKPTR